jgi:hypothetical protein
MAESRGSLLVSVLPENLCSGGSGIPFKCMGGQALALLANARFPSDTQSFGTA